MSVIVSADLNYDTIAIHNGYTGVVFCNYDICIQGCQGSSHDNKSQTLRVDI